MLASRESLPTSTVTATTGLAICARAEPRPTADIDIAVAVPDEVAVDLAFASCGVEPEVAEAAEPLIASITDRGYHRGRDIAARLRSTTSHNARRRHDPAPDVRDAEAPAIVDLDAGVPGVAHGTTRRTSGRSARMRQVPLLCRRATSAVAVSPSCVVVKARSPTIRAGSTTPGSNRGRSARSSV